MYRRVMSFLLVIMLMIPSAGLTEAAEAVSPSGYSYPFEENPEIMKLLDRAVEYILAGDSDLALASIELAELIDDQDATIYAIKAQVYFELGDLEKSRACAVTMTELAPSWAMGWNYLLQLAEPVEGEKYLRYLEVLDAAEERHYLQLADGFSEQGEYEKAMRYYEKCALTNLSDEQRENYCFALLYAGQMDKAVELGLYSGTARDARLLPLSQKDVISLEKIDLLEGYTGKDAKMVSLSPDGQRVIVLSAEHGWSVWNRSTRTIATIVPSADKGVADEYGKLERLLSDPTWMCEEEFVWSPDGRYAVPVNAYYVFMNYQGLIDPVLIDTFTGEAILTATWDRNLMKSENGGAIVHACFTADGRYLYYTLLAGRTDYPWRLMRYDIKNAETEVVFQEDEFPCWCYQGMYETADGGFAVIYSPNSAADQCGLTIYQKELFGWKRKLLPFDLPRVYFTATNLEFSGTSGFGVIKETGISRKGVLNTGAQTSPPGHFSFFKTFRLAGHALLEDGYWNLNGAEEPQLEHYTAEEYVGLFSDYPEAQWWRDNWLVNCIRISPDGYFALIACRKLDQGRLLLFNLETHQVTPVEVPDEVLAERMCVATGSSFKPGISWCEDGTLLLLTDTGAQAYRMK